MTGPEWTVQAGAAGLAVEPIRSPFAVCDASSPNPQHGRTTGRSRSVFVIGDRVLGRFEDPEGVPVHVAEGCRRLATAVGAEVLGARFVVDGEWLLIEATCSPDLRPGGEPVRDAVAEALR